jgi:hypothetical protein
LFHEPVEEFAPVARAAAVEPEGELVQIAIETLAADGPLMRA